MFEDFLLKECVVMLSVSNNSIQPIVFIGRVLEVDDCLMKIQILESGGNICKSSSKLKLIFKPENEVYLNVNNVIAISSLSY